MRWLILLGMVCSLKAAAQTSAHGAYGLFPQGSIRVIGMGGAFAALSDDASGILFNPAGLAHSKWKYDFGASSSQVSNEEGSTDTTTGVKQSYNAQFYAAAMKIGKNFVLGAGLSSPFELKEETGLSSSEREISVLSGDLSLAMKFGQIGIGVTGHYEQATLKFATEQQTANVIYPTVGISFKGNKGGFGVTHSTRRTHKIDATSNSSAFNSFWFRDVEIPAKTTIGFFYQAQKDLLVVVDLDLVSAPENAILAGTGLEGSSFGTPLIAQDQKILHGGIEYLFLKNRRTEVRMQAGGYQEPVRIEGGEDRLHLTLGLDVRFGPLVLGVSYDQAKKFQNTAASFSFSLGDI